MTSRKGKSKTNHQCSFKEALLALDGGAGSPRPTQSDAVTNYLPCSKPRSCSSILLSTWFFENIDFLIGKK